MCNLVPITDLEVNMVKIIYENNLVNFWNGSKIEIVKKSLELH